VVSEGQIHVEIARTRAGMGSAAPTRPIDASTVRAALTEVMDPELPMVSIVDLGMIGAVEVGETIHVDLLPTFIGCPVTEMIRQAVGARLEAFDRPVFVETGYRIPWTTDRITPTGRRALAAAGIAEPAEPADIRCPFCRSARVVMDSAFGPTQCRALYYCRDCRQPFEAMKLV
jgi:ring-1,2-phenylacetyl-CoA epoxidase subunit PaaD